MGMGRQTNGDKKPQNQKGYNGVKEANIINAIGSSEKNTRYWQKKEA